MAFTSLATHFAHLCPAGKITSCKRAGLSLSTRDVLDYACRLEPGGSLRAVPLATKGKAHLVDGSVLWVSHKNNL